MSKKFLNIILAIILVVSVFNLISMCINIAQKDKDIKKIDQTINEQRIKNNEYKAILADENIADLYKSVAEDELNYALNDEKIYIDVTGY